MILGQLWIWARTTTYAALSVIIFAKRTLSNFEVKPAYPMNAASNLNSLCCVAHIRGQSDFFWLLAWDNLCKAQHKHIRNEWSQEHPVKIQFLGQDRGLTFLHNPIFDDILTTPYPFKRYMCFSCFLLCPFPFQFFRAGQLPWPYLTSKWQKVPKA